MKGTVRFEGTSWNYRFKVSGTDGKQRVIRKRGFATQKEADAALRLALKPYDQNKKAPTAGRMTVKQFFDLWFAGLPASDLRPSTIGNYEDNARLYIVPQLGRKKLTALTPAEIRAWMGDLATKGGQKGKGVSKSTVAAARRTLSTALEDAVELELIHFNPTKQLSRKKSGTPVGTPPSKVEPWLPEEADAFLAAEAGSRWRFLWAVALGTGLRQGELCGLEWRDVDLRDGRLRVERNRVAVHGTSRKGVVEGPPKSGRGRTVELPSTTVTALLGWKEVQEAEASFAGVGWMDSGKVFTFPDGRPLSPHKVKYEWRKARLAWVKAGGKRIRFHDLRHTKATFLFASGADIAEVQHLLGHSDPTTTRRVYQHLLPGATKQAVDREEAWLQARREAR